jgi:hypothetical protein
LACDACVGLEMLTDSSIYKAECATIDLLVCFTFGSYAPHEDGVNCRDQSISNSVFPS